MAAVVVQVQPSELPLQTRIGNGLQSDSWVTPVLLLLHGLTRLLLLLRALIYEFLLGLQLLGYTGARVGGMLALTVAGYGGVLRAPCTLVCGVGELPLVLLILYVISHHARLWKQ